MRKDYNFHFLTGDVNFRDYGGKWYRREDDTNFTVIEMVNMEDACGDISKGKYLALISEVSLDDPVRNADALKCCGWTLQDVLGSTEMLIEAHTCYGGNQMAQLFGNNFYSLLSQAKHY
jgi:hypothetical protein